MFTIAVWPRLYISLLIRFKRFLTGLLLPGFIYRALTVVLISITSSSNVNASEFYYIWNNTRYTSLINACQDSIDYINAGSGTHYSYESTTGDNCPGGYKSHCATCLATQENPSKSTSITISSVPKEKKLNESLDNNQPNMCTGNPIDPVTGTKLQYESLINLDAARPLDFDIFYSSNRLEKWRHSFSRNLTFSDTPSGSRFNLNGAPFESTSAAVPESPSFLGGVISAYGKANSVPASHATSVYKTDELACETGWTSYKKYYHFSWVSESVAEYRITEIDGYGTVGQCYVLDDSGEVKKVFDLYEINAGEPLNYTGSGAGTYYRFTRENGSVVVFSYFVNMVNHSNTGETLEIIGSDEAVIYRLHTANDEIEDYDSDGKLISVESANGHIQTLLYDSVTDLLIQVKNETGESLGFVYEPYGDADQYKRIKTITDDNSRVWVLSYDAVTHNLISIEFPDGEKRQYHYENSNDVQLLTGVTDETGTRYASWSYDSSGRATMSAHGVDKNIDRVELNYLNNGQRTATIKRTSNITDSVTENIVANYITHTGGNRPLVAEVTGYDPIKYEHDATTGYLEYIEDKSLRTEYSNYDNKGNSGKIVEAAGTSEQREKDYTYDLRYQSKITSITEPSVLIGNNKVTTFVYDDFANNTSITITGFSPDGTAVNRSTVFEYKGPYHQLTQIDGPRTDVNDIYTLTYYPDEAVEGDNRARLKNVAAPLNINLYNNIIYTGTGKIQSYLDENYVQVSMDYYYGNDRLKSLQQLDLSTGIKRLTQWSYLATGEVRTVTSGDDINDQRILTYNYDDARRLTEIVDGLGNYIRYVLDSEGNVEQENTYDDSGTLKKQLTQTFDDYNRLKLRTQVNEQRNEIWSANGTLDKVIDGKNITTDYSYDNLRRLTQINQDLGGTSPQTADALTLLNYDVQDNLTYVRTPINGETVFTFDDLGNQLSRDSDDTGLATYQYDEAGNIITMVDANGEIFNYNYDALNRLTSVITSNSNDDYQFEYDDCHNGAGRLCKVINESSTQHYRYDAFGNITSQQSLLYQYDTADRLRSITYPSGSFVEYGYDAAGQIQQVTLQRNGELIPLANTITYEPFGDINNLQYGNGLTLSQSKDAAYRSLSQSILSVFDLRYVQYDANGNLQRRDDGISNTVTEFGYDEHDRLITASGEFGSQGYQYDKNANRSQVTEESVSTVSAYEPASNRLSMRGIDNALLDDNGNMLTLGEREYQYTNHNRLFEVYDSGILKATYQYNGLGQRVSKKLHNGPDTEKGKYFIYDTDGKLMVETDLAGNILFEYIYLNGQSLAKYSPDSDYDGISNHVENQQDTNPDELDSDNDGLSNIAELFTHGTQINNSDSDGDGISDSTEVAFNSDPLNSNSNIGDINLDGELNLGDFVLLTQYVLGTRIPTPTEHKQADVNQDDLLNVKDVLKVQRVLLGQQLSWFSNVTEKMIAKFYNDIIPPAYAANGDGDIYYIHNDYLGTPVKMTDKLGFVVWQAVYDPFGKASVDEDVDGNGVFVDMNVRFPGQYYDEESGLHYNYFRDYDPDLGRYIQADKLDVVGRVSDPSIIMQGFGNNDWFEFDGEIYYDYQSTFSKKLNHLYGYAGNNTLKNIDFYGLWYYGGGTGSLGDYFSRPNGNVSPGFTQQDYVCSSVACVLNPFPSMVERCIAHDKCYEKNKCNSSSWISNALGGSKSCNQCNSDF